MQKQITLFIDKCFYKFQCDLGFRTQQCLIALIKTWTSAVDGGKSFGLFTNGAIKSF